MSLSSIPAVAAPAALPIGRPVGGTVPVRDEQAGARATGAARPRSIGPQDELDLSTKASAGINDLTPDQEKQVEQLQARDREVRAHEQAHFAAAGQYAQGGPTYDLQTGPDGRSYAVGGQVQIDTSPVEGDPEATINKAKIVRAAALAPAEPSSQDRVVAAQAGKMELQARIQLQEYQADELREDPAAGAAGAEPNAAPTEIKAADGASFLDLLA